MRHLLGLATMCMFVNLTVNGGFGSMAVCDFLCVFVKSAVY